MILTILDGWGYSKQPLGNAILKARTPIIHKIEASYPSLLLQASGRAVGMSWGEAGNSEVGHLSIGAGRIIFQYLSRINKAIESGEFFSNDALMAAINHVKEHSSTLHLSGLITSGSVHAYFGHIIALLALAKTSGVNNVKVHLFTDGKDSGLKEGSVLIKKLLDQMQGIGTLATVIGRDFAMDRDNNWELTEKAYRLIAEGMGEKTGDIFQKLDELYAAGINDPRIPPLKLDYDGLKDGDAIIFFNFREDSMRQLAKPFSGDYFDIFPVKQIKDLLVISMTEYVGSPNIKVAFPIPDIKNGLAQVLSDSGKKQFHIAETEKYAHVTYFFNCLRNTPFPGETDFFVASLKDPLKEPTMKADEIAMRVVQELDRNFYDFIILNFANPDILSHTGNLEATVKGIEAVDLALGKIYDSVMAKNGKMIITADHGNAESVIYKQTGEKATRHDESPVPFYIVSKKYERKRSPEEIAESKTSPSGLLADVAPTILELMGIQKPVEMTGQSLLTLLK